MSRADRSAVLVLGVAPLAYLTVHALVAGLMVPAVVLALLAVAGTALALAPSDAGGAR